MEALKATGLKKSYGGREVLKGLDLAVGEGNFEALMGPSGSGKSTFLHIASGLVPADSGEMSVGGRDVVRMSDAAAAKFRRRHVGVVFQAFNLLDDKTVRDNILLPARLDGAKVPAERLEKLACALGLDGRLGSRCIELSGGERQRVAVARALLMEPEVVLADGPTGNLDAEASKSLCTLLRQLNETERSAILLVTHDPVVAATATKVHFLSGGVIAASCETHGDAALVSRLYLENCR